MSSCSNNNSSTLPTGPPGPDGAPGPQGADGENGTTVLYANISDVSTSSGNIDSLQSYLLPIAELATNGDSVEIICSLTKELTTTVGRVYLYMGGNPMQPSPPTSFGIPIGAKYCLFKALITRQSASTVLVQFDVKVSADVTFNTVVSYAMMNYNVTVNNLTSATNLIEIRGSVNVANTLTAHSLLVHKYTI